MSEHYTREGPDRGSRHPHQRQFLLAVGLVLGLTACQRQEQPATSQEPLAAFDIGNSRGKAPLSVAFRDHSAQGSERIRQWEWDFGDGHVSNEAEPLHRYEQPGRYSITLTVRNALGESRQTWDSAVEVLPADVAVTIRAVDTSGRPLDGLEAVSENLEIEDQDHLADHRLALRMRPSDSGGLLRLRRKGYLDGLLFINELNSPAEYSVVLQRNPASTPAPSLAAR